ncbi:MAG TPA: O-methyltransferase [Mycobacteriales bacterium]|jgi:predicted O-methyltransferase YrrM|nr:O-methyltransferase [Mycobacteriales bacterium]
MTVVEELWNEVDAYVTERLGGDDAALSAALVASAAAGLPSIAVSAPQGKFLRLLVRLTGARSVLEVGTLGGYSTIWLAGGLPAGGRVVTLEVNPAHAAVARANLDRAGLAGVVDVLVGPAIETLPTLTGPFDLVFIDADKRSNPDYVREALRLTRPGAVIVVDNVVRNGAVVDPAETGADVAGTRATYDLLAAEPRLDATAIQTVGSKGYDGFAIALVSEG